MTEKRIIIKYFHLNDFILSHIKEEMDDTLKHPSRSYSTAKRWVSKFKKCRTTINRCATPWTIRDLTTSEIIEKNYKIVLKHRRLKMSEIAEIWKISKERVGKIFWEYFADEEALRNRCAALSYVKQKILFQVTNKIRMNFCVEL